MSSFRRAAVRAGLIIMVPLLLFLGGRWVARTLPEKVREAENAIRQAAASRGLDVDWSSVTSHLLYLQFSIDNVVVRDRDAGNTLLAVPRMDVSISLRGLLGDGSPVSRIRARSFAFTFEERNRPLFDRLMRESAGDGEVDLPEILLLGGTVSGVGYAPLERLSCVVPEIRIRPSRFIGNRISVALDRIEAFSSIPGAENALLPISTVEADIVTDEGSIRIRRLKSANQAFSMKGAGSIDLKKRSFEAKFSGEGDLAGWIGTGAPWAKQVGSVAERGVAAFSCEAGGPFDDPVGSLKVVLRDGVFKGGTPADGEVALVASGKAVTVETLRGSLWDGALVGTGRVDLERRRAEAKFTLAHVAFDRVPWRAWGVEVVPVGKGDISASVEGDLSRVAVDFSATIPDGVERVVPGKEAFRFKIPVSVAFGGSVSQEGVDVSRARLQAGRLEVQGKGRMTFEGRSIDFDGSIDVPVGRASEFGLPIPIAWKQLSGTWKMSGTQEAPILSGAFRSESLSILSLPPVDASVLLETAPGGAVRFDGSLPYPEAAITARGSVEGAIGKGDSWEIVADASVPSADLSRIGGLLSGILVSVDRDPAPVATYLTGVSGTVSADAKIRASKGSISVEGEARSAGVVVRGTRWVGVSLSGGFRSGADGDAWEARAEGGVGDGIVWAEGSGRGGSASVYGTVDGIDLGYALSVIRPDAKVSLSGTGQGRFRAVRSAKGWEFPQAHILVPKLVVDKASFDDFSLEGSWNGSVGKMAATSSVPSIGFTAGLSGGDNLLAEVDASVRDLPLSWIANISGRSGDNVSGVVRGTARGVVRVADAAKGRRPFVEGVSGLKVDISAPGVAWGGIGFSDVKVSGRQEGSALVGEVATKGPDSRLGYRVALRDPFPFDLSGTFAMAGKGDATNDQAYDLAGRVEVSGACANPEKSKGTVRVDTLSLRSGKVEATGKDLAAMLGPDGVRWTGGVVQLAGTPVQISGKAGWDGTLDARVEGDVPASAIRLVTDVFDRLDGTIRLDVRVGGTVSSPQLVGGGRVEKAVLSFKGYAQLFEDMSADAVITKEKIIFERFEGRSGGGLVEGYGEIPVLFNPGERIFFAVDLFDVRYPYPEEFSPVVTGHIDLSGTVDGLLVSGDVAIRSALYNRRLGLDKALPDIRRRLAVAPKREKSAFHVRLDVNGVADGTIRIVNNLADLTAKGEFKVVGDESNPVVLGSFDVVEGTATYGGNMFEINRFLIDFQDPRRNNPRIDLKAETKKSGTTIFVSATGLLDKLEVDLSSDPPFEKTDIVALLTLGVVSKDLAGSEGAVGTSTAASVALAPVKASVEEGFRGVIGLDKFTVETSYSKSTKSFDPRIVAGKEIGDRLSVSVSSMVGAKTEGEALAELRLFENVYLEGGWVSTTDRPQGDVGADLKFKLKYRQFKDVFRERD